MIKTRESKKVTRRKAPAKRKAEKIVAALFETMWAIATNWVAALVTLSIHAEGRSLKSERPSSLLTASFSGSQRRALFMGHLFNPFPREQCAAMVDQIIQPLRRRNQRVRF